MMIRPFIRIATIAFMASQLCACHEEHDYLREMATLDSLRQSVSIAYEDIDHSPRILTDTIAMRLKYVQDNFVGTMHENLAVQLGEYASLKKNHDALEVTADSLRIRSGNIREHITGLIQALKEKATHDAAGVEITPIYVTNAVDTEKKHVTDWNKACTEWKTKASELMNQFQSLDVRVQDVTDSISVRRKK